MRECSVPALYVPGPSDTMADDVFDNADKYPHQVGYSRRVAERWVAVTHREFADQVTELAAGLIGAGIKQGDRVALMARTSFEWMLCDFAIWAAAAVTVPIYETSSEEQVQWILSDSGAVAGFVETEQHAKTVDSVRGRVPQLGEIWTIDAGGIGQLIARGRDVTAEEVMARRRTVNSDSLATIIYTSGTTGRPKGCTITHANLLSSVRNVCQAHNVRERVFNEDTKTLLFLPLAHILARVIQLAAVHNRVHLAHTGDIKTVPMQLVEFRPTSILSVPRLFERIYNTAKHKASTERKGRIFDIADRTAMAYSRALDSGGPGLLLRASHALFDRLVYSKIRAAMGGQVGYSVSGGAPLGTRLGHFFRGIGVNVLEGYGLTETCAGVTLNLPGRQRVGSVGRPVPGCSVRISDDGEVLLKGGLIFEGYWQNEAATSEAFDEDGWFRSGDLGSLDEDGYLTITGRKKDLIVTSSGKNVAPAVLEDRLRANWLVSQCVVVGDARPYVGALITIDPEVFPEWKKEKGLSEAANLEELREDPVLVADLQQAVNDANAAVSAAEAIKRFRVLTTDFTVESGDLTPSLKVKRGLVLQEFADEVEELYRKPR